MPRGNCGEIEPCYMCLHVCEGVRSNLFLLENLAQKKNSNEKKSEF